VTNPRVVDLAVTHTIERIAFVEHRPVQQGGCFGGEDLLTCRGQSNVRVPKKLLHHGRHGEYGTRDDAVEIRRIPLRFHERLAAAIRTTLEVRPARLLAVIGGHYGLGGDCRDVGGSKGIILAQPRGVLRPRPVTDSSPYVP